MKQVSTLTEEYRRYLSANMRVNTIKSAHQVIVAIKKAWGRRKPDEVLPTDVQVLLDKWSSSKPSTLKLRATQIKAFFNWISREQMRHGKPGLRGNPADFKLLNLPKAKKDPPTAIDRATCDIILSYAENNGGVRDRLLIEIPASSGLRASELLKLQVNDFVGNELRITEPKSGKHQETAYLPQKVSTLLRKYVLLEGKRKDDRLFNIGYTKLNSIYQTAGGAAGINGFTPHAARRFFGTEFYRQTKDLLQTQQVLRHADPTTTARYYIAPAEAEELNRRREAIFG